MGTAGEMVLQMQMCAGFHRDLTPLGTLGESMRDQVMSDLAKGAGVKRLLNPPSSSLKQDSTIYSSTCHHYSLLSPCGLSSLQGLCGHCLMGIWESK